jgi:hypothetical protein
VGAVCGLHVCKSVRDLDKDTPELCCNEPNLTSLCDRAEIVSAIGAQNSSKRARLNSETGGSTSQSPEKSPDLVNCVTTRFPAPGLATFGQQAEALCCVLQDVLAACGSPHPCCIFVT